MLCGAWPRVTSDGIDLAVLEAAVRDGGGDQAALDAATERLVGEVIAAQAEAGMDLLTDGQVRWPDMTAAVLAALGEHRTGADGPLLPAWTAASAAAPEGAMVAQGIPGPYTLGRLAIEVAVANTLAAGEDAPTDEQRETARRDVTLAFADTLAGEIEALAAAGCRMVMVEEPDAVRIGEDEAERSLFAGASTKLLARLGDVHAMLVIMGGSADAAGGHTIFAAPWSSLAVDLIAGPDNWTLVRQAPGDRGIVCAALKVADDDEDVDQFPQLVWAAHYAASSNGRSLARVGLANATPLGSRTAAQARRALVALEAAASYAAMSPTDAVEAGLDPKTIYDPRTMPAAGNRAERRRKARDAGKGEGAE